MAKVLDRRADDSLDGLYDRDFYTWCMRQAELVRARRLDEIDVENIGEELESLGKELASKLESAYRVLLLHLLKWRFQEKRRTRSWRISIGRERLNVPRVLRKNPGLKPHRAELFAEAYADARKEAALEIGLPLGTFPVDCPFTIDQALDEEFWPEPA